MELHLLNVRLEDYPAFPDLPHIDVATLSQWLGAVQIQPVSAFAWQCRPHWQIPPRTVPDAMWFYFTKGKGTVLIDMASPFHVHPGDLILIPRGVTHAIYPHPGTCMAMFTVHFYAHLFGGLDLIDLLGFPTYIPGQNASPFREISASIAREFAIKSPGWHQSITADITRALFYTIRHFGDLFHTTKSNNEPAMRRLIPALDLLTKRLSDPNLRIAELANALTISETYLRKLFQRATGHSPVAFIQQRRIEKACQLLRTQDNSIKSIADTCGFADLPFFYRVFRKWTRTTPARFRRREDV